MSTKSDALGKSDDYWTLVCKNCGVCWKFSQELFNHNRGHCPDCGFQHRLRMYPASAVMSIGEDKK